MRFLPVLLLVVLAPAGLSGSVASAAVSPPEFSADVSPVRSGELRYSYRAGCPVGPARLRTVRLAYWGFDGRAHLGKLVVNRSVTRDVVRVFRRLYGARFPIRRMVPVSKYRGSDDASMAADNTSAFNCRFVSGANRRSIHASGLAIDVNPVENPYVSGSRVSPPAGRPYADRALVRPGMAVPDGILVKAFASVGWAWGGWFTRSPDYQHFSATGRLVGAHRGEPGSDGRSAANVELSA
jgi:D-alanyl-D-alanine carboxypeptidase-like protein